MWALSVCWVLLGTLGAGSAQLTFQRIDRVQFDVCNKSRLIIPCLVTNLQMDDLMQMFVKWKLDGQEFFAFDGYEHKYFKNDSFSSAELQNVNQLSSGVASIKISINQSLPGNYTCIVVERNREGQHVIELQYGTQEKSEKAKGNKKCKRKGEKAKKRKHRKPEKKTEKLQTKSKIETNN